jgi:hypothetical protein
MACKSELSYVRIRGTPRHGCSWTHFPSPRPSNSRAEKSPPALASACSPPTPLPCSATAARPPDVDYGMRCPSLAAHTTLRHDILKGMLHHVGHRAGIASTQEPALRHLPVLTGGAGTVTSASGISTRVEARGDIHLAFPGGITIADISVIHPSSINTLKLASGSGNYGRRSCCSARLTEASHVCTSGAKRLPFVPFAVESYGRLGQPGDETLACAGRRSCWPWQGQWGIHCCRSFARA